MDERYGANVAEENPRKRGISEHFERASFLYYLAQSQKENIAKYRLMLTSIYSCIAITEIMLNAVENQEVPSLDDPDPRQNKKDFEEKITPTLPYYSLIHRIRIHDFHRHGIVPPSPHVRELMFRGPVKIKVQTGAVCMTLNSGGPQISMTGNVTITPKKNGPLFVNDGQFFDEGTSTYVTLEEILEAFLAKVPDAISIFIEMSAPSQLANE